MGSKWQLQEAKNKLSQLVDRAIRIGPQEITRRGKRTAVLISIEDYKRFSNKKGSLISFFSRSPLSELKFERNKDHPREVEI